MKFTCELNILENRCPRLKLLFSRFSSFLEKKKKKIICNSNLHKIFSYFSYHLHINLFSPHKFILYHFSSFFLLLFYFQADTTSTCTSNNVFLILLTRNFFTINIFADKISLNKNFIFTVTFCISSYMTIYSFNCCLCD